MLIHRHTGGLENDRLAIEFGNWIHRHTGGLESLVSVLKTLMEIHRHTGGLEIYSLKKLIV